MGILRPYGADKDLNEMLKQRPECFLCGEAISENETCIYWHGNDGHGFILLHKHCASSLACHLISDFTRLNLPGNKDGSEEKKEPTY